MFLARAYQFLLFSPSREALFVRPVGFDAVGMLEEFVERIQQLPGYSGGTYRRGHVLVSKVR